MGMPRFHPIAMNSNPSVALEPIPQNHQFPQFGSAIPEPGPSYMSPPFSQLDQIEARLRQLEQEETTRMAARSHLLAIRKREDEEFRQVTERAEAEEEELRRQRKRLKRESMGLNYDATTMDSPPMHAALPPRRLSETSAATTLAFFKQQSPTEPRPAPMPQQTSPPARPPPPQTAQQDLNGNSTMRRKQKYTIKNVEAWGERHGRPATHDPSGRALWKRPSDGSLVYLTCPVSGCGKADFVTLHGFMCHLTKKHKDRTLGSQSRALEICGVVYDPSATPPPGPIAKRAYTEEDSRLDFAPDNGAHDGESSSYSDDEHRSSQPVKSEPADRMPAGTVHSSSSPLEEPVALQSNGSTKHSISSILDRNSDREGRDILAIHPERGSDADLRASPKQAVAV